MSWTGPIIMNTFANAAAVVGLLGGTVILLNVLFLCFLKKWRDAGKRTALGLIFLFFGLFIPAFVNCLIAGTYCGNLPCPKYWLVINGWQPIVSPWFTLIGWWINNCH